MTLLALSYCIQIEVLHCVAAFPYKKRQLSSSFLHPRIAIKNEC